MALKLVMSPIRIVSGGHAQSAGFAAASMRVVLFPGHVSQSVDPAVAANLPTSQREHFTQLKLLLYVPSGHTSHAVSPLAPANLPGEQLAQATAR